jgi:ABC-2 type transport system ATP-binding protein
MSTGMRQKLALCVCLSVDARLLILDEPTSNLDPSVRGEVMKLVAEARRDGRSVIFSSHVLSEVEEVCDRVAILRGGELVHLQSLDQLKRQHRIIAVLKDRLPEIPEPLKQELSVTQLNGEVQIDTPGELSTILGWLATVPLADVYVTPVGLRAVYDRFHKTVEPADDSELA